MASYVGHINIGNVNYPIGSTLYGTCSGVVSGDSTSYAVSMANFDKLETGITIHVKFTTANISGATKLKVGNQTAKTITNPSSEVSWSANSVISFTYDGTNWIMNDGANTIYDIISETNVKDNTHTTGSLITGQRVNQAIDNKLSTLVDTLTGSPAASKTITAFDQVDGKISATFADIAIAESQVTNLTTDLSAKMPKTGGQFTGNVSFASGKTLTVNTPTSDSHAATKKYVDDKTAGLSGAMHFKGTTASTITDGGTQTVTIDSVDLSPISGDVVLSGNKEFVWTGSAWELLGDEGSYALKTITITGSNGLTGGGAISSNQVISHASRPATSATADETFGNNTDRYYIKQIKVDSYGHIFDVVTGNETVTNVDTKLRVYASATNKELPLIGLNQGNATASYTSFTSGSKDVYGAIPSTAANVATINPSTGIITAPGFKGALQATDVKTALSYDSSTAATTLSFLHKSGNWKTLSISYDDASNGKVVTGFTFSGGSLPTYTQGTKASASVSDGVLTITNQGTDSFTQGSVATLTNITKTNVAISAS